MASVPEPSWEGKGERAPVFQRSRRAMGEIKPGDDRRAVNGLFLSLSLSPSPSPRLYSRSPRAPRLITPLRDRRGHGGSRQGHGPSVHPRLPRWTATPSPPSSVSICLSPPDPPKMVFFEWRFHSNLTKLLISTFTPTLRSWKENGPTASSPTSSSSLLSWLGPRGPRRGRDTPGVSITES